MAQFLNISPVIVTQVLKGDRNFSEEQGFDLCTFFGFSNLETDFFLLLLKKERSGTHKLKSYYKQQIKKLSQEASEVKSRLPQDALLNEEAKAIFYSNWYYSGIRLLTAIPEYQTEEAIAKALSLPLKRVREVLEFLITNKLCERKKNKIICSDLSTHVGKDSPLVTRHHKNWREQSCFHMQKDSENNLFFTAPVVLDEKSAEIARNKILKVIGELSKTFAKAPSKQLMCLNIDWFQVPKS